MISTLVVLIGLLTLLSAFFSASEIAFFSLPTTKVRGFEHSPSNAKRLIFSLLSHPRNLLVTIFILNTLINILLQNVSSSLFGALSSWWYKVGVPLVITLVLGEVLPKYLAMQFNTEIATFVSPIISLLMWIMAPIREITVRVTNSLSKYLFFFMKEESVPTREELSHILKSSEQTGVLNHDEVTLITGYMELQGSQIKDHMQPREDVIFYTLHEPLTKLVHLFIEQGCSRIPLCEKNLDDVVGILSATDFFVEREQIKEPRDLMKLCLKPLYLPESTPARMMLRKLEDSDQKLALVVDEHRSVTGIISIEDLFEEVVGEITDSRDRSPLYELPSPSTIIAYAKLDLDDFNELMHTHLESKFHLSSIGGWLIEKIGEIPKAGQSFELENLLFQILEAEPSRIVKIYARKKRGGKR